MIDPPRVLSEEPTAVTPHGGICGGESQQWLSYPTKPHAGICAGGREQSLSLPRLDSLDRNEPFQWVTSDPGAIYIFARPFPANGARVPDGKR